MKILKVKKSKFWEPVENIKSQCCGAEWSRKSNLIFMGNFHGGGPIG